jgi:VanZ family protein
VLGVGCALAFSLMPGGPPMPVHVWDKVEHLTGYFVMMAWFTGLYPPERYPAIALRLVLFGILIEGLQALTPTRTAELGDALANATGIGLAYLAARAGLGRWALGLERLIGLGPR